MSTFPVRLIRWSCRLLCHGFFFVFTRGHALRGKSLTISEVILATDILSLDGGCGSQAKTMIESHHACTSMSLCYRAALTDKNSRLNSKATHSSRRGRDCCFSGRTPAMSETECSHHSATDDCGL